MRLHRVPRIRRQPTAYRRDAYYASLHHTGRKKRILCVSTPYGQKKGNGCTKNVETCHRRVSTSGGAYKKHQMVPGKTSDDTGKIIRPFPQLHTMSRRRACATSPHDYHHKIKCMYLDVETHNIRLHRVHCIRH